MEKRFLRVKEDAYMTPATEAKPRCCVPGCTGEPVIELELVDDGRRKRRRCSIAGRIFTRARCTRLIRTCAVS
jgi:hypothetical protein